MPSIRLFSQRSPYSFGLRSRVEFVKITSYNSGLSIGLQCASSLSLIRPGIPRYPSGRSCIMQCRREHIPPSNASESVFQTSSSSRNQLPHLLGLRYPHHRESPNIIISRDWWNIHALEVLQGGIITHLRIEHIYSMRTSQQPDYSQTPGGKIDRQSQVYSLFDQIV